MSFEMHIYGMSPPESFSRQLDKMVASQEMPYGYTSSPPPADSGDYDSERLNSTNEYHPHKDKR